MSIKDIVQDRLNRMEDLEQRKLLKNMMSGLFFSLAEYQEEMQRKLEDRLFNEVAVSEEHLDLYVTLCAREDIDPIHEFLFPMCPKDVDPPIWDAQNALRQLDEGQHVYLYTVFLACDYLKIKALMNQNRIFQGEMKTNKGIHRIKAEIRQSKKYLNEIENLYNVFLTNGRSWKTVNHPYASKFFDVFLISMENELQEDEIIQEVSVDLEEFEPFKQPNIVPLWNIEQIEITTVGFPFPALDKINYEHTLPLQKTGIEHGYLVAAEEDDVRYIKRMPDQLTIVSPINESRKWSVLKIIQPQEMKVGSLNYELVNNKHKNNFINHYEKRQNRVVRTRAEILRIMNSFEIKAPIKVKEMKILQAREQDNTSCTYELNPFLSDNLRAENNKMIMQISFFPDSRDDFIFYDLLSFLVSEVQRFFPEYKCEGVVK